MSDSNTFRIPRKAELVAVSKGGKTVDVKPQLMAALDDDTVIEKIEAYKTNGGVTGHKLMDDIRALDIVLAFDDEHGGAIRRSGLKEAEVLAQFNVVLRRRYTLDKDRKIVGVNPKHYQLLGRS